ncbi:MAG: YIP1 family protein [Chitinispirillaceae bacterium]|nr:YIP1 family protein [Chitinispirillaceae bacterium]
MKCPHCGKIIPYSAGFFCNQCGALLSSGTFVAPAAPPPDLPAWETEKRLTTTLQTLFQTIFEVIFSPDRFFKKAVAKKFSALPAWIFGLAAGSIGLLAALFWSTIFRKYGRSFTSTYFLLTDEIPLPYMLIAAPFFFSLQLFFTAAYIHIMLRFSRLKKASFSQTFRILCYAESPLVLQIIPLIGTLAGSLLSLYALLTGLHHLYTAGRVKLLFLLLLPFIALAAFILIVAIAGVLGGIIAGTGFLQEWRPFFDWRQ